VRTRIDLPKRLLRRARALAAKRGTTLKQLICEGLEAVLAREESAQFRLEDRSFAGEGFAEGVDGSDLARIRERIYEGRGE
jgi:hypothetical protein